MPKLMVIAGEASGDLHGGNVLQRLKTRMPELEIFGTGGKLIEAAGAKLYYQVEDLAVIGFWEVLKKYSYYKGIFNQMVALLDSEKPDAVFLVDYPGFNLRFAKEAHRRGIPVYYYVAPQVWAWKEGRIEQIRAYVDELILLFPFEVDWFAQRGIQGHCFGHPLVEIAKPSRSREAVHAQLGLDPSKTTLSILPGSRRNEILKHLAPLVETVNLLHQARPEMQFIYPIAPTVDEEQVKEYFAHCQAEVKLAKGITYDLVGASDFALVASGTASLETAIIGTPMMIYYKVSKLTYWIGRYILKIGAIGLPNIVAGKEIIPEFIQHDFSPAELAQRTLSILENPTRYQQLKQDLAELRHNLGESGAYEKTAQFVQTLIAAKKL